MKKSRFLAFIASAILLLTGCNGANVLGKANVNIKRLSASVYDTTETAEPTNRKNAIDIRYANEKGDSGATLKTDEESSANYILIYKDENNIQLTVQLDNPKGESIDALEIACDDEDAEILVDGEYKSLNVTSNGRVVNWAQEDPYEKTFYLKTISQDDLNTFRINDIKVNGAWQNKGLDNNELSVYKITKDDLDVKFIANTTEYYECEITHGDKISSLTVSGGEWVNGTNHYKMTQNGAMKIEYDYTFDGLVRHWVDEKEIELLHAKLSEDMSGRVNRNENVLAGVIVPGAVDLRFGLYGTNIGTTIQIEDKITGWTDVNLTNSYYYLYEFDDLLYSSDIRFTDGIKIRVGGKDYNVSGYLSISLSSYLLPVL